MAAATEEAAVDMVAAVVVAMAAETVVAIAATEEVVADMVAAVEAVAAMAAEIVVAIVATEVAVAATEVAATRMVWEKSIAALNPQNLLSI